MPANDLNIERSSSPKPPRRASNRHSTIAARSGQGIFEALDAAAQAISSMTGTTPDAGTRVAGSSLWLQEVNQRVDRQGIDTLASTSKLLALVGGYERMGVAGAPWALRSPTSTPRNRIPRRRWASMWVGSMVEGGSIIAAPPAP